MKKSINGFYLENDICNVGVRQCENLSPFFYWLHISDLYKFWIDKNIFGLQSVAKDIEDELFLYFKLLIFHADDTVILAETPECSE